MELKKEEILAIIIASVIFGFALSFRKWGDLEFSVITGLLNWLLYFFIASLTFLIMVSVQKLVARKNDGIAEVQLWNIKRLSFRENILTRNIFKLRKEIPIGIIMSIFLTFFSFGYIKFAGILETNTTINKNPKLTKKFKRITEFETALVAASGPITALLLSSLISIVMPNTPFTETAYLIALTTMVPLGSLDGAKLAFSSLPLYITTAIIILMAIPALLTGIISLTIIASIVSFIYLLFLYFVKRS